MDDPGEDGFMWSFGDEGHQSGALIIVCTEYSMYYSSLQYRLLNNEQMTMIAE